jgi:hypothetical protein
MTPQTPTEATNPFELSSKENTNATIFPRYFASGRLTFSQQKSVSTSSITNE